MTMTQSSKYEPKKYVVDDETLKVSVVVGSFMGAMAASNWVGRVYPDYECNFITDDRYQQLKEENKNAQTKDNQK